MKIKIYVKIILILMIPTALVLLLVVHNKKDVPISAISHETQADLTKKEFVIADVNLSFKYPAEYGELVMAENSRRAFTGFLSNYDEESFYFIYARTSPLGGSPLKTGELHNVTQYGFYDAYTLSTLSPTGLIYEYSPDLGTIPEEYLQSAEGKRIAIFKTGVSEFPYLSFVSALSFPEDIFLEMIRSVTTTQ